MLARRLPLLALAALLVAAAPAHAAPDWSPAVPLPDANAPWQQASIDFDGDGTLFAATAAVHSIAPISTTTTVNRRDPGGPLLQDFTRSSAGTVHPLGGELAVASDGRAVLVETEAIGTDPSSLTQRWLVRYRHPDGTWEAAVPFAQDFEKTGETAGLEVEVGPDGTVAAVVAASEANTPGEAQFDRRIWVAIRRPGSAAWDIQAATPANVDASYAHLGIDAGGNVTIGYRSRWTEGGTSGTNDDLTQAVARHWTASNGVWSGPIELSPQLATREAGPPVIGVAPDGRAVAAWQDEANGHKLRAALRDAGGAWQPSATIVTDGSTSAPRDAAMTPDGAAYVAFTYQGSNSGLDYVGAARAIGGTWTLKPLSAIGENGFDAVVGVRGNDALLGWSTYSNGGEEALQAAWWRAGAPAPEGRRDLATPAPNVGDPDRIEDDGDGSMVVLFTKPPQQVWAAAHDGGPPRLVSASVPSTATAGQAVGMSATFADAWSALAGDVTWSFGDGGGATGGSVQHTYGAPGTYTVTARRSDVRGNERVSTFTIAVGGGTGGTGGGGGGSTGATGSAGPGGGPRDTRAPRMRLAATKLAMNARGVLTLRLRCPADEAGGCTGTAALEAKARRRRVLALGRAAFRARGGTVATLRVTVPRARRAAIRRAGRRGLAATLVVQAADAAGNRATTRTAVRLTRAAKQRRR